MAKKPTPTVGDPSTWHYLGTGTPRFELPYSFFGLDYNEILGKEVLECKTPYDVFQMCIHPIVEACLFDSKKKYNACVTFSPFFSFLCVCASLYRFVRTYNLPAHASNPYWVDELSVHRFIAGLMITKICDLPNLQVSLPYPPFSPLFSWEYVFL